MSNRRFQRVPHVETGSPVSAANTSQSTRALEERTNSLQEELSGVAAGKLLQWPARAVSSTVLEGTAVFWNATTSRFEPGLAAAEHDTTTGAYIPAASADVLGVCLHKDDSTTGTIIFAGFAEITPAQVANLFGTGATPGRYYLSGSVAGRLTKQRPAVTIAVAYLLGPATACDINSWVYILPQHRNFLEDHVHYQLELTAAPAGTHTPPDIGESHSITEADTALAGWLPADDASFNALAPTGAVFGYNIAADTALSAVWPPIPASAAILEILRPTTVDAAEISGFVRVPSDFVRIDLHGIWWMTDCYNQVPWVTSYDTETDPSSSSAADTCPVAPNVRLILSFLKMLFATDKTVVTSITADDNSPIEFLDAQGNPASTGDITVKLNLGLLISADEAYGGQVLKSISDTALTLAQGWVAEGLISGSSAISLTSTHQRRLTPTAPAGNDNPLVHQGIVTVTYDADIDSREIFAHTVKLTDTQEREHKGVFYIGFPTGRTSSAKFKLTVPVTGLPTSAVMVIRTVLFGRTAGPLPAMTMTYYKLARPETDSPVTITDAPVAISYDVNTPSEDVDGEGTELVADQAIEITSEAFSVTAGDTLFVTIRRASDASPGYSADVGLIRISGMITAGG